ncbi:anti-sigma factor family protein [Uniformispora flossi]|uniref:anti-sigma factor family protein n=1 Tax=Uniformispora flossi TaxID=3390723 RepID=UPI003C2BD4DC
MTGNDEPHAFPPRPAEPPRRPEPATLEPADTTGATDILGTAAAPSDAAPEPPETAAVPATTAAAPAKPTTPAPGAPKETEPAPVPAKPAAAPAGPAEPAPAESEPAFPPATPTPDQQICGALRLDLGAYVLGTLDETETRWVRSHVAVCPECRAEYDELAVLPAFLARLTPAEAEATGTSLTTPPERVFADAAEKLHRDRRTRTVLLAAAAACAVLFGTLGWVLGSNDDTKSAAAPPPSSTSSAKPAPPAPSAAPAGEQRVSANSPSGTAVTVAYRPVDWGTAIDMNLKGVAPGTRCQLDVYGTRNRNETASSWIVPPGGYDAPAGVSVPGGTSIPPAEITRFVISVVGQERVLIAATPTPTPQQNATNNP